MGCPVKKVVNGYAGSALMKDEKLASALLDLWLIVLMFPLL